MSSPPSADEFAAVVRELPGHWVANEHPSLLDGLLDGVAGGVAGTAGHSLPSRPRRDGPEAFLTALDGIPVGWCGPHGQFCD